MEHGTGPLVPFETYDERRDLSFEQAEGLAPLPQQLQRAEISPVLRARMWELFKLIIDNNSRVSSGIWTMQDAWAVIFKDEFVRRHGGFVDSEVYNKSNTQLRIYKILREGGYLDFYGPIQFILSHPRCTTFFSKYVDTILEEQMAAFRVVGKDTLVAVASPQEVSTIESALNITEGVEFLGPHRHLKNALRELGDGKFADSVRESIHSVESIARTLEPTADLSKALGRLEKSSYLHRAMKHGFCSLYGYTSD